MAEDSWPSPNHSSDAVTDGDYELLVAPYTPSGVIGSPADTALIFGDSSALVIKIRANRYALNRGRVWSSGGSDTSKSIGANSSASTRYDLVVLRLDRSTLDVRVAVVAGTPGSGPPSPTYNTGTTGVYELPLATVKVVNGATVINNTDVTPVAWFLGPQRILCTSTTRPPHSPGLPIYEYDTNNEYVSTGSAWSNPSQDSGWVQMSAASGWAKVVAQVRNLNGAVYLQLQVTRSGSDLTAGTNSTLCTVPSGYRPATKISAMAYFDNANLARVTVDTNGIVTIDNYHATLQGGYGLTLQQCTTWPLG